MHWAAGSWDTFLSKSAESYQWLAARGPGGLTTAELIALLWGSGTRGRSAVELATDALATHDGLTGLAPVYSNFQWRTPLLAIEKIVKGEEVPTEWVLPQVPITEEERGDYLEANEGMPDGHYAKFGGEDLPGYPEVWQERQIP